MKVNANTKSQNENGEDGKENKGVYQHSLAIGGEAAKFHVARVTWYLKKEAW